MMHGPVRRLDERRTTPGMIAVWPRKEDTLKAVATRPAALRR